MTKTKLPKISALRNIEYYGFQEVLDKLYADSENSQKFTDLMGLIPTRFPYKCRELKNGTLDKSNVYAELRNTNLKECYIVRYADDFKIFCRNRKDAENIFAATKSWLCKLL